MENYFTKKEQVAILLVASLVIISFTAKNLIKRKAVSEEDSLELLNLAAETESSPIEDDIIVDNDIIMVHISGQVYYPGLVELESGLRLVDAIEKAGGLKKEADLDRINLAKKLADEEKIYIPKIGEEIATEDLTPIAETMSGSVSISDSQEKININNCTKDELMSLPGIGPVTADKIIAYREANPFKTIEEIMDVSGIGEKKFEAIMNLIISN